MNMVDLVNFKVGQYTIRRRHEPGHPHALYCVFLNYVLIGRCVSVPDLDACLWLEEQQRMRTFYAYSIEQTPSAARKAQGYLRVKRKVGRPVSKKTQQDIAKALAGD